MKATGTSSFFSLSPLTASTVAFALVSAASLLSGCSDGDPKPNRLDVATAVSPSESDDEWLRKQERLIVTTYYSGSGSTVEEEQTVATAMAAVVAYCSSMNGAACGQAYNVTVRDPLCAARTALALSTPQSDPIVLEKHTPPPVTYTFKTITEANAAEFAIFAVDMARIALDGALNGLEHPDTRCSSTPGVWTAPTQGPNYAGGVVEAYHVGRKAYDRAIEATLAMADAARSSSSSPTDAARRSLLLEKFSRSAAAHILVGGDDGILGSKTRGYCAGSRLSPRAQSALQLLRDAAPSPGVILDSSKGIQDLLSLGSTTGGPVRQRLAALHQIKPLGWDPIAQTATATPSQSLESYYDLDENDFVQARDYLQQELEVFNRSQTALLTAVNGTQRYAGSAGLTVPEIPAGAWAARARFMAGGPYPWYNTAGYWPMAANGALPYTVANYHTPPLDTFVGETFSRINTLIRTTTDTFSSSTPALASDQREVLGTLGSILLSQEYLGAIEVVVPTNETYLRTIAHGFPLTDKVRVVVGEDGLRCAVQGNIEGGACGDSLTGAQYGASNATCNANPATLSCLTINIQATASAPGASTYFGTTSYTDDTRTLAAATVHNLITSKTRLYFVRLKSTAPTEAPGNFELLTGTTISNVANNGTRWNSAIPVVPRVDALVADVLAPNRKNCVEQAVDCLGVHADARLPLEDELTDDSNGFENSWKHYLSLARQAADEAASLGREFRDAKLNKLQGDALIEQRKEEQRQAAGDALQDVQNMCGTALDTNKLLDFLSRDPVAPPTKIPPIKRTLAALIPPATASCPSGRCLWDITKATPNDVKGTTLDPAELKRFQDCVDDGPATVEPFVTLGNREFCVESQGFNVCPANSECYKSPPCAVATATAKPLGYFTTPTGSTPNSTVNACEQLRIARGLHTPESLTALTATGVFNPDRLRDRLGQLGIRAEYGGFFAITEDKSPRLSSGNAVSGRSALWPWGTPAAGCMGGGGVGLFCKQLPSNATLQDIGAFNARVFRATYAAAAALGEGLEAIYPSKDDASNATPCDGKAHETEYHTASAAQALPATMPVWSCAGRKRANLTDRLKYDRSLQPRASGTLTSWILADGTLLPSNTLNLWGYGAPRCIEHVNKVCNGTHGRSCENIVSHECFWDDLSSANPGRGLTQEQALRDSWAGLSPASVYGSDQGLVYAALQSDKAGTDTVLFEGGEDNNYMSPGDPTTIEEGSTRFYYYRVPLNVDAVLDGQEILCELDRLRNTGSVPGGTLDMTTVELASDALKRIVEGINENAAKMFFANVPKIAADALNSAGPTGAFPSLSGDMGEAVSSLRQGFIATQHALPVMSNAMRTMANELQALNTQLQINQAQSAIIDWDTLSTGLKELTACAQATAKVENVILGVGAVTAITCANSAAQIAISLKKGALQKEIIQGEDQKARLAFVDRMSQIVSDLEQAALGLSEARESINGSLSRIDGIKKRAKLAVSRALYMNSYHSESQAALNASAGALEAVSKKRFDEALKNAKLMSFYAKRAIEQRLGLSLRDQREDLPLVQAPALWEGEACSYSGFQDIVDPNAPGMSGSTPAADAWVEKFGNGFIGDYVTKLENFVESYRLEQNFHEGKDTAVVSLRDDVANVRAQCSKPARNLFLSAADLRAPAWAPRNCDPVPNGSVSIAGINCISAVPRLTTTAPVAPDLAVPGLAGFQDSAPGFNLQFGDGKNCVVADSGGCGWKPGSALSQVLHLEVGRYRVSWYTLDDPNAAASVINGAKATILILRGTGSLAAPTLANSADSPSGTPSPFVFGRPGSGARWKRASEEFNVTVEGDYEVGFGVPSGTRPPATQQVTVAAPMLEALTGGRSYLLGNFQSTDELGYATIADCEDTDGAIFRLEHWTRDCVRLCTDGFSANCRSGPEHCYHEFNFGVSQAALQNGKLLNYSGFARGNFNYRIDSLSVNFVGSSIRNCENASLPDTCYNAGFVPYSLLHNGPFFVRNRAGDDFQALLFDGRIEHARGLALGRYFTSPISSIDRDLISDYVRGEFSGRPLDGNFTLRIWDDQGVDFNSIQDVQLILNYRYWTAFN